MEYLMSLNLNWTDWLLGSYIVLYGYIYGVHNTFHRIIAPLKGNSFLQHPLGKCLDFVWYVVITLTVLDMVTGA